MTPPPLQPLPAPGLAIFPTYLSTTPLTITLKGSTFSRDLTATLPNGTPLFQTSTAGTPFSRRQSLIDPTTQTILFHVRKAGAFTRAYYADAPDTGQTLFAIQSHAKLFGRARECVSFANQADVVNGAPMLEVEFVAPTAGRDGEMVYGGRVVAVVEKVGLRIGGEYRVHVAPGLDPSVVVGVMLAVIDRARKRAAASASAGGAG